MQNRLSAPPNKPAALGRFQKRGLLRMIPHCCGMRHSNDAAMSARAPFPAV
jgi:hypothetical protein